MNGQKFLTAVIFAALTLAVSSQAFAQADIIEKRQAAMKSNNANAKAIKAAIETKDYATVETKAKDIMGTADRIPSLFQKVAPRARLKPNRKFGKKPMTSPKTPKT